MPGRSIPRRYPKAYRNASQTCVKGIIPIIYGELHKKQLEKKLKDHFDGVIINEFSINAADHQTILKLISEMRVIINNSTIFDAPYKIRLLNRLSQLEKEMYKTKGNFDVILGGIVDFGETLGTFGKKVKPLTDRMREIRLITQKKAPEYQRLPPPEEPKMLPPPEKGTDTRDGEDQ